MTNKKKEFEKKFAWLWPWELKDFWSFISKALKQAREEERKRILGIVEGMKYKPISKESPEWLRFGVGGYNKALTDIKKVIKK